MRATATASVGEQIELQVARCVDSPPMVKPASNQFYSRPISTQQAQASEFPTACAPFQDRFSRYDFGCQMKGLP